MASVKDEIDRIVTAKENLELAIEDCGVDVPYATSISDYAGYVRAIPTAVLSHLDLAEVGADDKYIKKISQTDGVISATAGGVFTKSGSSASVGLVPKPSTIAGTSKFLREDATWQTPPNTNYYPTRKFTSGLQITDTNNATNYASGALFVPHATDTQSGIVTTSAQTFEGTKTFNSSVYCSGVYPKTTNSGNLGSSLYKFNIGYINQLYVLPITTTSTNMYISGVANLPSASSSTSSRLYSSSYAIVKNSSDSSKCAIYAPGGFYESSDERLKNISDSISVSLKDLQKLRKIYYIWKDDKSEKKQIGLVAQDVQKLYPELVEVDENTGLLSLAYDKLSVVALAAVDKLHEEISSLQKKNTELEDRISKLENLLLYGKKH